MRFAGTVVAALLLGVAFWPWAQAQPLVRPFQALSELTHLDYDSPVLFRGLYVPAPSLSWDYPMTLLLTTTPLVVLAGMLLSIALLWRGRNVAIRAAACWLLVVFPVGYIIARHATLYDGVRHLTFVYPLMVILAAAGWLGSQRQGRIRRVAILSLLAAGLAEPLVFQWRNHPNQIVYFNALVGGPGGAFGRHDLDYWGSSLFEATEQASAIAERAGQPLSVSSGEPNDVVQINLRRFTTLVYSPLSDGTAHLHLELFRGGPDRLNELLRAPNLFVVRTADGAPLSVIQPGPRFSEIAR